MSQAWNVSVVSFAVLAASAARPALAASIEHGGVGCVVPDRFPRFEVRVTPADAAARGRVFFRAEGGEHWYAVAMQPEGEVLIAFLPKPQKTLKSFTYYVEVADTQLATSRTKEYTTRIGAGGCGDMKSLSAATAMVLLEAPAGAAAIPPGFGGAGIVAAGSSAGGAAAGGATAAAGGGGVGAGTVVLAGAGVAAAAGTVAAVGAASGDEGTDDESGGGGPPRQYSVNFPSFIDVSICAGRPVQWCCQPVIVSDPGGRFSETWSGNEPNTLRVNGTVTNTTFTASIACVSGAASGTINASGSGGSYSGEYEFAGQRGPVTITRRN